MSQALPSKKHAPVTLNRVTGDNWRDIAKLKVTEPQRRFVAEPLYYLALCSYGDNGIRWPSTWTSR